MIGGGPRPDISVVIPAFNARALLPVQLRALNTQSDAPDFEVIVVDNGSTDGTGEVARSFAAEASYPLRVVRAAEHQGPGYARNVGAGRARADLLMFADADDVVSRWWIRSGKRAFETSFLWSGGATPMSEQEMRGDVEEVRARARDTDGWEPVRPGSLHEAFPVVMGCDFGCTRQAFEAIGGFDQSHGTAFEDNDFGLRAHRLGITVDHAPAVRIAYRVIPTFRAEAKRALGQTNGHVLDVIRYGLERESALPNPAEELARTAVAAVLMAAGRRDRNWTAIGLRAAVATGLSRAWFRHRVLRRSPRPLIGLGYSAPSSPDSDL